MINSYLLPNQLKSVFGFLFNGKRITLLRFIRQCGFQKVCWIYYNQGNTFRATFISFRELTRAYLLWLSTVDLFKIRLDEKKAIGRANYLLLNVGDVVFRSFGSDNKMGIIIEKAIHNHLSVVFVDWGNCTVVPEMPWGLEKF